MQSTASVCRRLNRKLFTQHFINSFDCVLSDCDGVLWISNKATPGAVQALQLLRDEGKKVFFVSNNPISRETLMKKIHDLGFNASLEEVYSAAYCCASYLRSVDFDKKVYALGNPGLNQEFDRFAINYLADEIDAVLNESTFLDQTKLLTIPLDPEVGAVVISADLQFNYVKLLKAASYLGDPDVLYMATSTEKGVRMGTKTVIPGVGSIVAAVSTASNREPLCLGKPAPVLFECIQREHPDILPSRCLMIGDSSDDILFARNNGMQSLLVLSGVTKLAQLESGDPQAQADYFLDTLGDLNSFFQDH